MQIIYGAVDGGTMYRQEARRQRSSRLAGLLETVAAVIAGDLVPEVVAFPAGYFQVASAKELRELADDVVRQLDGLRPAFGVLWGIDILAGKRFPKTRDLDDGHPFFVSYRSALGKLWTFQQVSVSAMEGNATARVAARWGERPVVLPGTRVALLICGESWSDELLQQVARANCDALVIAAHRNVNMHRTSGAYGRLSWHMRLDGYQRASGIPTVLAEHTRSPRRHAYAWPERISEMLSLPGVPTTVTLRRATIG